MMLVVLVFFFMVLEEDNTIALGSTGSVRAQRGGRKSTGLKQQTLPEP